jgi:BirA family biotin operon repressor/biotin-[acetyl-CoA-carboxylase] ligase
VGPEAFALLRLLAPGGIVPAGAPGLAGETLRAAREALAAHGLAVRESASGLQLARPFDSLDAEAVRRALGPAATRVRLEIVDECASTNLLLAARAAAGEPAGLAIACELQTAGRGRRGATWFAGLGTSLTFSLLWRPTGGTVLGDGLSLAVGVACARALESIGARGVALKWPNDLLLGEAKLGGILVEAQSSGRGATDAVIGIGLNVRLPERARRGIDRPVADLAQAGFAGSRNAALGATLAALDHALERFAREGFAPFRAEWTRRHAWQGRKVRLLVTAGREVEGVAAGVAEDGALLVDTDRGPERFHAGEVTLREAA